MSLLSVLLSILRSDPMVLDGLQRLYGLAGNPAKALQDSEVAENTGTRE
jgi:hypothetical protein